MGSDEVQAFLSHLAVEHQVSASIQNQPLAALLFLYRQLLERDVEPPSCLWASRAVALALSSVPWWGY
jgi:hypothetical protein